MSLGMAKNISWFDRKDNCNTRTRITEKCYVTLFLKYTSKKTEEIQKTALTWLIDHVNDIKVEKLETLLSFITASQKLPPWRLEKEIVVKPLPDNEQKLLPEATTCFNISCTPVVHESKTTFYKYMNIALDCESSGFSEES